MDIKLTSRFLLVIFIIVSQNACFEFETESILKDTYDVPVKVITKHPNTAIYDVNDKNKVVNKVDWFQFFYRYNIEEDGLLLIAQQLDQDKADGWISKKSIIEWDNREAICLGQVEDVNEEQLVSFYSNLNELLDSEEPVHTEEPKIIFDLSRMIGLLPNKIINKITSVESGLTQSQLKKKLKIKLGKSFEKYWDTILNNSNKIADTYSCNALYTRYNLPMPALSKFETNDNTYYQVAFKYINDTDKERPFGFNVGWIKIPTTRKHNVKVYMKLSELKKRREQLIVLGQKLLEKPDVDLLNSDRTYLKRLLSILTGETIQNQEDTSLFSILMNLPKAKKAKEIITLENNKKYAQVKHTLKMIDLLILELEEVGQEGGWINIEDTL